MDPNQAYADLLDAVRTQDHETALELATNLSEWLAKGGFCPTRYSSDDVHRTIAAVMRSVDGKVAFSLTCCNCDAGEGIQSEKEAKAEGWIEIESAPQLLQANHLGVCPDCRSQHES